MGNCVPIAQSSRINESVKHLDSKLESNLKVVQLLPNVVPEGGMNIGSYDDMKRIFIELIATSFSGDDKRAPEAVLSWCQNPECSENGNPAAPLKIEFYQNFHEHRIKYFKVVIEFCFEAAVRHGGCFALYDEDKMVAATITLPPSKIPLHKLGLCEMMAVSSRVKGIEMLSRPPIRKRMDALDKIMAKGHDEAIGKKEHIYVWAFASDINLQGKGYGRKLMGYLNKLGDHMLVDTYLETSGIRNERFYGHHGFELSKRYSIVCGQDTFKPDDLDGLSTMIRTHVN